METVDRGCRVPAGKVFVMGDNRSNSEDSRVIGPIDRSKIVGHAFVVLWPPSDFGGI
jgi:signal peptidase I